MRVIAGTAKGRRLSVPKGLDTRPMTSRAREALFSSLGSDVVGAVVLDLFAGSGALGIEAMSRGATSVTFVERGWPALKALNANLEATGFPGEVIAGDALSIVRRLDSRRFDLVFADPPFDLADADVARLISDLVEVTTAGATIVVHRRAQGSEVVIPEGLTANGARRYGDSDLWRYTRTS